jgi:hypothetical protein
MEMVNTNRLRHFDFEVPDYREFAALPAARFPYIDEVLRDGPLVYWRLNDAGPAAVTDTSKHSYDGVVGGHVEFLVGGALTADGDRAIRLAGDGGHIELAAGIAPTGAAARTFELWLFVDATPAADTLLSHGIAQAGRAVSLHVAAEETAVDVDGHRVGAAGLELAGWHHLAWTFPGPGHDSSAWRLWIDGHATAVTTMSGSPQAMDTADGLLRLGRHLSTSAGWAGRIDEFAIYDRALPGPRLAAHWSRANAIR